MVVNEEVIAFQLDSGDSVNLLSAKHIHEINLKPFDKILVIWNGTEIKPLSDCRVN